MKKSLIGSILTASALLLSGQQAFADGDELFRGRASLGLSSYEFIFPLSGSSAATSSYTTFGAGGTYAKGNVYFDASINLSMEATHDFSANSNVGFLNGGEFLRSDIALTVGYVFNNGWSAFGGYKSGTSEFLFDAAPGYSLAFDAYGFYGGGSKSIDLGQGKSITFSGALGILTGEIYDNAVATGTFNADSDDEGTTIGLSLAAVYNLPLNDDSGISIRGVYQSYTFTDFTIWNDIQEDIVAAEVGYYINF